MRHLYCVNRVWILNPNVGVGWVTSYAWLLPHLGDFPGNDQGIGLHVFWNFNWKAKMVSY